EAYKEKLDQRARNITINNKGEYISEDLQMARQLGQRKVQLNLNNEQIYRGKRAMTPAMANAFDKGVRDNIGKDAYKKYEDEYEAYLDKREAAEDEKQAKMSKDEKRAYRDQQREMENKKELRDIRRYGRRISFTEVLQLWIVPMAVELKRKISYLTKDKVKELVKDLDDKIMVKYELANDDEIRSFLFEAARFNAATRLAMFARDETVQSLKKAATDKAAARQLEKALSAVSEEDLNKMSEEDRKAVVENVVKAAYQKAKTDKDYKREMDKHYVYLSLAKKATGAAVMSVAKLIAKGAHLATGGSSDSLIGKVFKAAGAVSKIKQVVAQLKKGREQAKAAHANNKLLKKVMDDVMMAEASE
ncbi:MAG TPA: hypothetical protein VKS21_06840, partial [Spirochaetota bacterium]|nr:hypothetical protein [Spirochaetota bacterium]